MATGLGLLRLPPHTFWSMTPREFAAAIRAVLGDPTFASPPSRADLASLMRRFPDRKDTSDG